MASWALVKVTQKASQRERGLGWRFHAWRPMPYPYRAMPTAAVTHLGCKLNQSEAEALSLAFARAGYDLVPPADGPDVFVLNSCTVTHVADRKSRQMLRRAKRRNPASQVIATGCYAHRAPQDLEAMAEVDLVVDNRDKMRLLDILGLPGGDAPAPFGGRRARSMVKIQEGCNQVCAYCIVPKTRGRERSLPIDQILDMMRARTAAGYREIVLTGTQLGSYGFEFGPPPDGRTWYEELVRRALDETGVTRLRFSSLQPQEITDGMIDLYREERLCPHVHIPLQSGSDPVLRRMRRRYSAADFRRCVDRLRSAAPGIAITTDIIVGFPGETEADFGATVALAEDVAFAQVHVFPYSHRPGTSAAHFADHLDPKTKAAREARLLDLADRSARAYRRTFEGHDAVVLWEEEKDGRWSGLTEHYVRAFTTAGRDLRNEIARVRVVDVADDGLRVDLLPE